MKKNLNHGLLNLAVGAIAFSFIVAKDRGEASTTSFESLPLPAVSACSLLLSSMELKMSELTALLYGSTADIEIYISRAKQINYPEENYVRELFSAYYRGSVTARDLLAYSHLRLVVNIALGYAAQNPAFLSDLISEGNLALLKAIDGFNEEKAQENRFLSYASTYIRGEMRKFMFAQDSDLQLPEYEKTRKVLSRIRDYLNEDGLLTGSARDQLLGDLNRNVNDDAKKITADHIAFVEEFFYSTRNSIIRVDQWVGNGGDDELLFEIMIGSEAYAPHRSVERDMLHEMYKQIVEDFRQELDSNRQFILQHRILSRFESDDRPMKLQAVGEVLGVTHQRVAQIERELKAKLIERLEGLREVH